MIDFLFNRVSAARQYVISILAVLAVSASCYLLSAFVDYRVVAFLLLVTVSLVAVLFDIFPVLAAAFLSALIWDFFFIPPRFTLQVDSAADGVLLLMYFVIAMVNGVLTYRIKSIQKDARKKIERENIVKLYNTFLNSLSHELKTPIATIIGAMDNLLTNAANLTPLQRNELLVEVSKASFRLDQQVGNLLNMSRLDAGFIQPKNDWVDISELVYGVVKRVEENKVTQHISINVPPDLPLFRLDKGMLEQVVYNLVNNAVQHTPAKSTINISVADYEWLQVIVEDNGNGFPEDERPRVFEKFYRLKRSGTGGTGLGLSIVRGFAQAMGGKIMLENVATGGARFTVSIPAEKAHLKY